MDDIKDFQELLETYESLPKMKYECSYLDICKYPGSRFEEICSRILAFYFQPKNEHGFNTLFLETLFETIGNNEYHNLETNVDVKTEENAAGKRIDILITGGDFWIIGIENKIWANVYNPLEIYKEEIEEFAMIKKYNIVLTLHEIRNKDELEKIEKNDFTIVLYADFFKILKTKIGDFIQNGNTKYLVFLYDFMQTLEYMKGDTIMSKELDAFFSKNTGRLEDLLDSFKEFKKKQNVKIFDKLKNLRERIVSETKDEKWGIYYEYLWFSKNDHDIGVESYFVGENNNPTAYFQIEFTAWTIKYWSQYGEQLKKIYPHAKHELKDNRNRLYVEKLDSDDEEKIIAKLKECYDCIINLK